MVSNSQEVEYRRHVIRSALVDKIWQARAFRNKAIASDTYSGESREEVVSAVKAAIDQKAAIEAANRDAHGVPDAAAFLRALRNLWPLPAHQLAMLKAHFEAPERILTATQLAAAAGWDDYSSANLHYGKLGFELAQELDWTPPKGADGNPTWTMALADGVLESDEYSAEEQLERLAEAMRNPGHFQWKMRPQVAAALKTLLD